MIQEEPKEGVCHWCGQSFINCSNGIFVFEGRAHWIRAGGRKAASVPESALLEPPETEEI